MTRSSNLFCAHNNNLSTLGNFGVFSWHWLSRMAELSSLAVFCLCDCSIKQCTGQSFKFSNANKLIVFSISLKNSWFSSPRAANSFIANDSAASKSPNRINSINCCCWSLKYKFWLLSKISGFKSFTRSIASLIFPCWRMSYRIWTRSEILSRLWMLVGVLDSWEKISAASLYPSTTK